MNLLTNSTSLLTSSQSLLTPTVLTSSQSLLTLTNHVPAMEIIINNLNEDDVQNLSQVNKHFNTLLTQHYYYSILYRIKKYNFLLKIDPIFDESIVDIACCKGDLIVLKYLLKNGYDCTEYAMDYASKYGHLDIVRFLHEVVKAKYTKWAMNFAAENGHLITVKYLHEEVKVNCTEEAMNWAAKNGHLETVKYLREVVKINYSEIIAIIYATRNGHLEIVNYLKNKN